jgi:acyl dehydratase
MPLNTATVGGQSQPFRHQIDARWTMAYAAALDDLLPAYMDTEAAEVIAHPLFPVCLEWPAILDCVNISGAELSSPEERARGVHAAHDLHLLRPLKAGETLTTQATIVGLETIRPGAAQTTRLDTVAEDGQLVARTYQLGITRGVAISGGDRVVEAAPALPEFFGEAELERWEIAVPGGAAHTYTECARIWNPIHTDRAVAVAAGLPDIILHGTATLALAISHLVRECLGGDPTRVTRLGGRFSAMVLMPSTLTLVLHRDQAGEISFTMFNEQGERAISHGFLCYQ